MEFDALKNSLMIYLDKQQGDNKATCTLNVSFFSPLKDAQIYFYDYIQRTQCHEHCVIYSFVLKPFRALIKATS